MKHKPRPTQTAKLILGAPDVLPNLDGIDHETSLLLIELALRAAKRPPVELDLQNPDFTIGDASFKPALSILATSPNVLDIIANLNPSIRIHLEPATGPMADDSPAVGVMPGTPRPWEYLLMFGPKVSEFNLVRALLTIQLDDEHYPSPEGVSDATNWADVMVDVELHRRLQALGVDVAGPSDAARADSLSILAMTTKWPDEMAAITLVENELWPTNDAQLVSTLRSELLSAFPGVAAHADSITQLLRGGRHDTPERAWEGLRELSTHLQSLGLDGVSAGSTLDQFIWAGTPQAVHQA